MRILVTGATGFVGSQLVPALKAAGLEPILVVRRPAPAMSATYVVRDLAARGWTVDLPSGIEVVIHLAQSGRYRDFPSGASDMLHINVDSTAEIVDWSGRKGVRKFIFASTGNVYAASAQTLYENSPCLPQGFYACSKFAAEQIIMPYATTMEIGIARLFGIYGPNQRQGLVATILDRVRSGKAITLAGDVGLRLTPLHVKDCVRILVAAAVSPTLPKVFNLGGKETVNLADMARMLAKAMTCDVSFESTPGQSVNLVADSSLAYRHFGIEPNIGLDAGLQDLVAATGEAAQ